MGSTAVVANSSGSKTAEVRYKAWGSRRYTSGTSPTSIRYTGQRVEATLGLYYYGARWYDPVLGRFVQADSVVASMGDPQAWDRYAYVNNNPVKFVDPTGHCALLEKDSNGLCVRTGLNTQIVRGGSAFRNPVEKSFANYLLSGNTNQLHNIPDSYNSADINRTLANVSSELGLKDESNSWTNLLLDPNVILGSMVLLAPQGNNKQPTGGVYTLTNPNGQVVRIGRTKDLLRREGEYARYLDYFDLEFRPRYYTDDYATQRGLEQMLYDTYHPPMNVNRPISPTNKRGSGYMDAALDFLMNLFSGH